MATKSEHIATFNKKSDDAVRIVGMKYSGSYGGFLLGCCQIARLEVTFEENGGKYTLDGLYYQDHTTARVLFDQQHKPGWTPSQQKVTIEGKLTRAFLCHLGINFNSDDPERMFKLTDWQQLPD